MPDRMPEDTSEDMSEDMPEDMPDRMPDRMPEDLSEHMPEAMPDRMPEGMPDSMPEVMPSRVPEDMPEDLPVRTCINVMVGITRSKVILWIVQEFLLMSPHAISNYFEHQHYIRLISLFLVSCVSCQSLTSHNQIPNRFALL
jgi:hypothetical protein